MRDIEKYEQVYLHDDEDFGRYQVRYRRKKTLELYQRLDTHHVVELGCGMEPLFSYVPSESYDDWIVVEPAETFYHAACKAADGNSRVHCLHAFFQNDDELLNQIHQHAGESIDLIVCTSLLHELESKS